MNAGDDDAQRAAFAAVAAEIRAMPDPVAAFEAAGELVDKQSALRGDAARLRAEQAKRIFESGDMTITALARRLGVTKQRAGKLLRRAQDAVGGER